MRQSSLLCIEILSPDDRWGKMNKKIEEYFAHGVPEVWVIDPVERAIRICRPGSMLVGFDPLKLAGTDIVLSFSEVFE